MAARSRSAFLADNRRNQRPDNELLSDEVFSPDDSADNLSRCSSIGRRFVKENDRG